MGWDFSVSPSKLNVLRECERCFFDANIRKIDRPRGIFPSLPGGVDRVMKQCMDHFRGGLPPHLDTHLTGRLWGTVPQMEKLRNWRSGLKALLPINGKTVNLIGALDDLIIEADETYSPYDIKTKGSVPKDDGAQYYQVQMDCYALLLRENGMPPSGKAYLDYWYPNELTASGTMSWGNTLYTITADPSRAVALIEQAVTILTGVQPDSNAACEYCRFWRAKSGVVESLTQQPMAHVAS